MSDLLKRVSIVDKQIIADGVAALQLAPVDGPALAHWQPGAHIDVTVDGAPENVHQRQYSLCGDPTDVTTYRIGVLRHADGRGTSRYIHARVTVGDHLTISGPRNNFAFRPSPRYLFIAGGIGITPILPMVKAAEAEGADWRLLDGGRMRSSMAFLDELAGHTGVAVHPQDELGLLDLAAYLGTPDAGTLVYCCGPEPLLAAVNQQCQAWPAGALQVERFSAVRTQSTTTARAFDVVLQRSGRTLTVAPDRTVLQVLRGAGVSVQSSCEEGVCGTCEVPVLDGEVDHRDSLLTDDERAANDCMMICVSRAATDRLVLDL